VSETVVPQLGSPRGAAEQGHVDEHVGPLGGLGAVEQPQAAMHRLETLRGVGELSVELHHRHVGQRVPGQEAGGADLGGGREVEQVGGGHGQGVGRRVVRRWGLLCSPRGSAVHGPHPGAAVKVRRSDADEVRGFVTGAGSRPE